MLLPEVGDLFWVPSFLLPGDPEDSRPIVVVERPRSELDSVQVITRTHDTKVRGVLHPADRANGLNLPGVFALKNHRRIQLDEFIEHAEQCGSLLEPYLSEVLEMWRL